MNKIALSLYAFIFVSLISCNRDDESVEASDGRYEINSPVYFGEPTIPSDNPITKAGKDLGRHLFYEKMLSVDSSISCGSCHQQALAFTDGKAFSDGVNGKTTRSSMSLANLAWKSHFFWDGKFESLEEQAIHPIEDPVEMNLSIEKAIERLKASPIYRDKFNNAFGSPDITRRRIEIALAQFQRTLVSGTSKYDKYKQGLVNFTEQERRGEKLFFTHPEPEIGLRGGDCGDCHSGALTRMNAFHNNGLDKEFDDLGRGGITGYAHDMGRFIIPTVRNIALTAPYMHDGRFETLEEVLDHYNEHIQPSTTLSPLLQKGSNEIGGEELFLTEQEKKDIIVFLHTLTDEEFIQNPEFSNPHEN